VNNNPAAGIDNYSNTLTINDFLCNPENEMSI
jgi:hypothetical protein